ncbi:MAG: pilus assembly protein [Methylocystis sp.]|nr:pilus assembly protein [Methylocystis sp.]MCA3584904.1 pilus assembly protein [Methylocystis sp.]MCA3589701.1 pilus assembly protein [Methylocystis sp.]MCA3591122.1 pilus assembly protein [Methylocystis sp.]
MRMKSGILQKFRSDQRGNVALMFAFSMVPIAAAMGAAVDYSNMTNSQTRIQAAADSAVLAAAKPDELAANRLTTAKAYFEAQLSPAERSMVKVSDFTLSSDETKIFAKIDAFIPTYFFGITGRSTHDFKAQAAAAIGKPYVRQLDIVMCIDATDSMDSTVDAVKNNALNLEANLNAELKKKNEAFDAMRVRVIFFRDYGGNILPTSNPKRKPKSVWWGTVEIDLDVAMPDYWKYSGDKVPMNFSPFYTLPSDNTAFKTFVDAEVVYGGGDIPESGLECVNEAMDSPWAKVGDVITDVKGGKKTLDAIHPVIVVWTDQGAHAPGYSNSLKNPDYPPATKMPRTYADLRGKWDNPAKIDQSNKMLVFFGDPDKIQYSGDNTRNPPADGWLKIKQWPNFMVGGTLNDGNTQLVSKLAGAIIFQTSKRPTLIN